MKSCGVFLLLGYHDKEKLLLIYLLDHYVVSRPVAVAASHSTHGDDIWIPVLADGDVGKLGAIPSGVHGGLV